MEKHFSEKEYTKIIKHALNLQQNKANNGSESNGLTLSELEIISKEIGIDKDFIRKAVSDVEERKRSGNARLWLGSEVSPFSVETFPVNADNKMLEKILTDLDTIAGQRGNGSVSGSRLLWRSDSLQVMRNGTELSIEIRRAGPKTEVKVTENLSMAAVGVFGGIVGGLGFGGGLGIGLGVGIGALGSVLFSTAVPLIFLSGSWFLSRLIFNLFGKSRKKKISEIKCRIKDSLDFLEKEKQPR